jgi:hypothetical protein
MDRGLTGVSSCNPDQVFVKCSEGSAVQKPLGGSAECVEVSGTDRVGNLLQEFRSLGSVGARGGKVTAMQLSCGEIDQNLHALSARHCQLVGR